ncbi:hypothetical protein FRC03_008343 [Tulasnella sp. 419]|nr:hypothetical protein FRC03_008343 [Tulasnella sp. 419]
MGDDSFSDDEVEALNKFAPRSLRCIKSFQSRVGFWLIEFCPWITGLSLGDDLHEVISRDSYAKLCTDNLVELQWFGRMDYLTHLLGVEDDPSETRRHSIEILGLRDATDMMEWELGRSVLQSLGPGLRSLHLNACNPAYVACIIKHVRNLEEFILDVLPSEELLDALPPTIQHLQIRSPSNISCTTDLGMDRLLHWIPTAKNLKVLTWVAWGCSGHGLYESIEALCKQMGAQLRLYAGPFGVFPGELETLACGHVKSFPRPLAFSPARKGVYQMTNSVKQFVGGLADHATQEITDDSTQPAPPRRNAIKSRYSVPNPRVVSFNPKTPTSLDPSSGTFVPETASNAFTFSSPQTSLPVPSGSSVPSTAQSTFKFSFGTKPTS